MNKTVSTEKTWKAGEPLMLTTFGRTFPVTASVGLYKVRDCMGAGRYGLAIVLHTVPAEDAEEGPELYGTLTVNLYDFIGMKNAAYIDTNNIPGASSLLEYGIAKPTGLTKRSGFCEYPLWVFNEDFLKAIGGSEYQQYLDSYEAAMKDEM